LLPPLGIIFGLFVVFTAAQVWTDNEKFARYCTPNSFIQQGSDLTPSDLRWVRSAKNHDPGCIS
jgi:hypothetical protein